MSSTVHHDGLAPSEPDLRPGSVVVGISTAPDAGHDRSLRAAGEWAARRHVDVKLVVGLGYEPSPAHPDDPRPRSALAEIDQVADHLTLQLDLQQRIHTSVRHDSAVDALLDEAATAGLVVLQRRRLGPLARLRVGSTTALVAANADCPVLIVHADDPDPGPSGDQVGVLVGVDQRGHGGRAIAEAFEEASWRGVGLTALMVWEPIGPTLVPPDDGELETGRAGYGVQLAEQLAGYRDRYPDVAVRELVLAGQPEPVLADLSRRHELVVVARHAEGHSGRRNLGPVTRRIIEEAHCPVLVTPTSRPAQVRRHRQAAEPPHPGSPS